MQTLCEVFDPKQAGQDGNGGNVWNQTEVVRLSTPARSIRAALFFRYAQGGAPVLGGMTFGLTTSV